MIRNNDEAIEKITSFSITDFGFANIFQPDAKLQTFCGSPPYEFNR